MLEIAAHVFIVLVWFFGIWLAFSVASSLVDIARAADGLVHQARRYNDQLRTNYETQRRDHYARLEREREDA